MSFLSSESGGIAHLSISKWISDIKASPGPSAARQLLLTSLRKSASLGGFQDESDPAYRIRQDDMDVTGIPSIGISRFANGSPET